MLENFLCYPYEIQKEYNIFIQLLFFLILRCFEESYFINHNYSYFIGYAFKIRICTIEGSCHYDNGISSFIQ